MFYNVSWLRFIATKRGKGLGLKFGQGFRLFGGKVRKMASKSMEEKIALMITGAGVVWSTKTDCFKQDR